MLSGKGRPAEVLQVEVRAVAQADNAAVHRMALGPMANRVRHQAGDLRRPSVPRVICSHQKCVSVIDW